MVAINVLTQTVGPSSNLCEVSGSRTSSLAPSVAVELVHLQEKMTQQNTSLNGLCEHFCAFTSAACSSE